MIEFIWQDVGL